MNVFHKIKYGLKGFSLIEVMIAVLVIMVLATAFVPLFVFVAESAQGNRAKLVATALAKSVIEDVRSREYLYEVGLDGGNPVGDFEPIIAYQTIDEIEYTIVTQIGWVDDPADGTYPDDKMPFDYKWVRVTVSAPSAFRGEVIEFADFDTLVAREGGDEAFSGIRAHAYRGWNTQYTSPEDKEPVKDALVNILTGPGSPIADWTDDNGRVLFNLILGEGEDSADYTVELTPPAGSEMILHPDHAGEQTVEVPKGLTVDHLIFELEKPCTLNVEFEPELAAGSGTIILQSPIGQKEISFDYEDVPISITDIWPLGDGYAGSYSIRVEGLEGFNDYNMDIHGLPYINGDETDKWQGVFTAPDTTVNITVPLSKTFYEEPPFKTYESGYVLESDYYGVNLIDHFYNDRYSGSGNFTNEFYQYLEQRLTVKDNVQLSKVEFRTRANGPHTLSIRDGSEEIATASVSGSDWITFDLGEQNILLLNGNQYRFRFTFPSNSRFYYETDSHNGELWRSEGQTDSSGVFYQNDISPMGLITTTSYQTPGYRISNPIDLSDIVMDEMPDLRIYWEANEPEDTTIEIRTAITTDTTPPDENDNSWETLSNGQVIPGLPESPEGYLWIKQILSTEDTSTTPVLEKLEVIY